MLKLSLESLEILDAIAEHGSFGRAAEALGKAPSAVTYAVRKLEDDLDTLIFDRRGYRAQLTPAGTVLLEQGRALLQQTYQLQAQIAQTVSGWELELRVALDALLPWSWFEPHLTAYFAEQCPAQLRIRRETLGGTWDALFDGRADIVIGVTGEPPNGLGISTQRLFEVEFVYCVAPQHPLAQVAEPIDNATLLKHRAIAVGDSARRLPLRNTGLLPGQQVLVVPDMAAKLSAQIVGLGGGYLAPWDAAAALADGRLVSRTVDETKPSPTVQMAWRNGQQGRALRWWRERLPGVRPPQ